jgi:hypothetical protein
MIAFDKTWALNQLRHRRNAHLIATAAMRLINGPELSNLKDRIVLINGNGMIFDPDPADRIGARLEFHFNQLLESKQNTPSDFEVDMKEFYKSARRNLVKESFEVTTDFVEANGLLSKLRLEPWYYFAYHVRNAITHDFRWEFTNKKTKALLPTTWNGKTIEVSMEGTEIIEGFLDPFTATSLALAMEDFVKAS